MFTFGGIRVSTTWAEAVAAAAGGGDDTPVEPILLAFTTKPASNSTNKYVYSTGDSIVFSTAQGGADLAQVNNPRIYGCMKSANVTSGKKVRWSNSNSVFILYNTSTSVSGIKIMGTAGSDQAEPFGIGKISTGSDLNSLSEVDNSTYTVTTNMQHKIATSSPTAVQDSCQYITITGLDIPQGKCIKLETASAKALALLEIELTPVVSSSGDTQAPTLAAGNPFSPANSATDIAVDVVLKAKFSEPVKAGKYIANIKLMDNATSTPVAIKTPTFSATDSSLNIELDEVILGNGKTYHVEIPDSSVYDNAGNAFAGISNTAWVFTTTNQLSDEKNLTALTLQGQRGASVYRNDSIFIAVAPAADLTKLRISGLTISDLATASVSSKPIDVDSTVDASAGDVTIKVTAQDATFKNYTLRVSSPAATGNTLLTFKIGTVSGVIRNDSVLVKLPASTADRSALVATFTCSEYAKVYAVVNSKDSLQTSGTTANDFTNTVVYKVRSEAGVDHQYKVVTSVAAVASGVLLTENFDYDLNTLLAGSTEGATSSITGWTLASQNSGTANPVYARVEAKDLEYTSYLASGAGKSMHSYTPTSATAAGLTSWTGSGTVNILSRKEFDNGAEVSTGKVYVAFLLNVATVSGSNSSGTEVLSFYDPNTASPLGRVWLRKGTGNGTKYFIGVSKNAAGSALTDGTNSSSYLYPAPGWGDPGTNSSAPSSNATQLVVLKYSFNANGSDSVSLFLNPTVGAAEPNPTVVATDGNDLTAIKGIIIRQAGSTPSEFYVGGIRVATSWSDAVAQAASNTNANISSFALPGSVSFKYAVQETLDTLLISTLKKENLTGIAPVITLEGAGATISPASGVAQNFSYTGYVKYTVTAADGNTKQDYYVRGDVAKVLVNSDFIPSEGWTDDGTATPTVAIKKQLISIGQGIYKDTLYYFYGNLNSTSTAGCGNGRLQLSGGSTNKGYIELRNLPTLGTLTLNANSGSSDPQPRHALLQIQEQGETEWRTIDTISVNGKTCSPYSHNINLGSTTSVRIQNNIGSSIYVYDLEITSYDDKAAPTVSSYSPANEASNVALTTTLTLTFNEKVQKGTGNITISDGTTNDVIAVTSSQVTINGNTVTITPTANLAAAKTYHVLVAAGAIRDLSGNSYAGISNNTTWAFQTVSVARTGNDITKLSMKKADGSAVQKSAAVINTAAHTVGVTLKYATYGSAQLKVDSVLVSDGAALDATSTCILNTPYTLAQLQSTNNTIVVEAENGATQAWTLNVTVAPNDSADIRSFVIPSITHTTKFVKDTIFVTTGGIVATTGLVPTIGLSTGATVSPASGAAQDFSYTTKLRYTVTAAAGNTKDWYVIFKEAARPAFTFYGIKNRSIKDVYAWADTTTGAVAGIIDAAAKTVSILLPYGTDMSHAMKANFTLSDLAEAYIGTTKQDTSMAHSYAQPIVYTLKTGNVEDTWTVTASVKQLDELLLSETFSYSTSTLQGNENAKYNSSEPTLYKWTPSEKVADAAEPGLTISSEALTYDPQGIPYIHSGEGKSVQLGDATTKHMDGIRYLSGASASEKLASGSIYACFMFHPDTASTAWREFFEFVEGSTMGNSIRGRVWAKLSSDKTKILVAATKTSNAPADNMAVELERKQTSLIVLKYTYGYDGVNAAIAITSNPIPGAAEPASNLWKTYTSAADANSTGNYAVGILRQDLLLKGKISGLRLALSWSEAVSAGDVQETGSDFESYEILVSDPNGDYYRTGTVNKANRTIAVNLPAGTDLSGLVAKFTLSYGAEAYIGADKQESDVTANDFSSPVTYTVRPLIGSPASWTVTVRHDGDVPNAVAKNTLSVAAYPNPATTYLQINSDEEIDLVEVFTLSGAKVMTVSKPGNTINISHLNQGSYLVKFTAVSKKTMAVKIIK